MARSDSEILQLVGRLHEGVVDDDEWANGLDAACAMIGSPALLLGVVDQGRLGSLFGHRLPTQAVALLVDALATALENPWVGAATSQPLRRPVTIDDLGGQQALERTRLWREIYQPFGIGETAGAILERQPGMAEIVMIGRPSAKGSYRAAEIKAFDVLIPHFARAWRVKRALAEWEALAGTLKFILDRMERAIVVAGPEGELRFANRAADRLLTRGDGIDATNGRIRAARSYHSKALTSLIERAARTGAGGELVAVDAISIPGSDEEGPPLAVIAEPLAPGHSERLGHSAAAGAILFISDSDASTRPSEERLAVVYGLTPAEARITSLIVEGQRLSQAADVLGVSPNTVKYHLKAVFEKVGVSKQAQLVRRVLADVGGLAEPEKMTPSAAAQDSDSGHPI